MTPDLVGGDDKDRREKGQQNRVGKNTEQPAADESSEQGSAGHGSQETGVRSDDHEASVPAVPGETDDHRRQAHRKRQAARDFQVDTEEEDDSRDEKLAAGDAHQGCHDSDPQARGDADDQSQGAVQRTAFRRADVVTEQEDPCDGDEQNGKHTVKRDAPEAGRPPGPEPRTGQASAQKRGDNVPTFQQVGDRNTGGAEGQCRRHDHEAHRLVDDHRLESDEAEYADEEGQTKLGPPETDKTAKQTDRGSAEEHEESISPSRLAHGVRSRALRVRLPGRVTRHSSLEKDRVARSVGCDKVSRSPALRKTVSCPTFSLPCYNLPIMKSYDFGSIEKKWQERWAREGTFRTLGPGDDGFDGSKPKFYVLDMFPYPSGAGLHVGHPLGYIATDIVARYKRMRGHNVMHPMGFDAFGLPAEQYALEHGVHPRITTEKNIGNMRRQLKDLGLSYDWDRELATIDVDYYRWTQWIFVQLFESWYDHAADKAKSVDDLVRRLESGDLAAGVEGDPVRADAEDARPWTSLPPIEQRDFIDGLRLAYAAEVPVNWCPALGTVLANEEVTAEGRSERGNHPVFKRPLKQWMLRITAYAERLLADLDHVDWPESIKLMQRNWIGRSEGAMVDFPVAGSDLVIDVFTTRPDTLFGATYMVLAPEHPFVDRITTAEQSDAVAAYQKAAAAKSDVDRQMDMKSKTGVFTGAAAVNPVNGEQIPIWIADYVLTGYGTGAIMAVPGHDSRDFEFAKEFGLTIRPVVTPDAGWLEERATSLDDYLRDPAALDDVFAGEGESVHSANEEISLDGRLTPEASAAITAWIEEKKIGAAKVQFKLRDWLFSRQRYWGEPFPILHGPDGALRAVDENDLPVLLPEMEDFRPAMSDDPSVPPQPSLSRAPEEWRVVEIDGEKWERELNTMPQWAGSCWYYLRFIDPANSERMIDPEKEKYWMSPDGIDLYLGGVEHAVLHLLYARFWHKLLHDLGHVSTDEPFRRLFNQGYIQAYAYTDERGVYVDAEKVEEKDGRFFYDGREVTRSYGKMGKSLKNAVTPDDMVAEYGCDSLRLYEMYMGPLEVSKPWSTRESIGVHRFLQRLWRNFVDDREGALLVTDDAPDEELLKSLHKTIKRVTDDMEGLRFNTAIAALIELNNRIVPLETLPRAVAEPMVLMLAPLAPHFCEELWEMLGHEDSLAREPWPEYDEKQLVEDQVEIVVQVMGKLRGRVTVPAGAGEEEVRETALADPNVQRHIEGKTVRKVIYVKGRLVNIVAN